MDVYAGVIVQARMSSERLGGKVLREVAGKPLLGYLLERLGCCRYPDEVVVATSDEHSDDAIERFCNEQGVRCFRGPLDDVAMRFSRAAGRFGFDAFVRVSGDSPLLDYTLVDRALEIYLKGGYDLVTNILERTFPKGQSVEVLNTDTFDRCLESMVTKEQREHVMRYFYDNPDEVKIFNMVNDVDCGWMQLSVDTADDLQIFESIVDLMERPHWEYGLDEVIELRAQATELLTIG